MGTRSLGMILLVVAAQVTVGRVLAAEAWICSVAAAVAVDEDGTVGATPRPSPSLPLSL